MVQIKPVLRPAGFLWELNLVLTNISVAFLPYHTPVIFTPATLATLDLWTIYFPQNNEVFVILAINNDLLFLSKISRDSHHQVNH